MIKEKEQTLAEHFAENLRPDIAEKAIANLRAQGREDKPAGLFLADSFARAFNPSDTPEGRQFWEYEFAKSLDTEGYYASVYTANTGYSHD
jgi:hypothetical protein